MFLIHAYIEFEFLCNLDLTSYIIWIKIYIESLLKSIQKTLSKYLWYLILEYIDLKSYEIYI